MLSISLNLIFILKKKHNFLEFLEELSFFWPLVGRKKSILNFKKGIINFDINLSYFMTILIVLRSTLINKNKNVMRLKTKSSSSSKYVF